MAFTKNLKQKNNSQPNPKKVLVALSGGVDSAVSAALLKDKGYSVYGAHMVCWDEGPYCTTDQDRASAAKVAAYLNIPFQVYDFRKDYKDKVIEYFYSEYEAGRTPNPDVACNREIKFGIFFKKALELGFDYIATGHYARVEFDQSSEQFKLFTGSDPLKDQSYFLYNLNQKQLMHTLFPIGHLTKVEVRDLAAKLNLPNATKKDSQGICFIGDVNTTEFLEKKIKTKYGEVVTPSGVVIGKHKGLAFYTIGQREGVGISQKIPHYVVSKDRQTNTIVAAPFNDESHFKKSIQAENMTWVGSKPKIGDFIQARIRYRQPLTEAKVQNIDQNSLEIEFFSPQKAVTPGQALVLYQGEALLGGGTII